MIVCLFGDDEGPMAAPTESWMIDSPTPEPDNFCERCVSVLTSLHSISVGLETFIIRV